MFCPRSCLGVLESASLWLKRSPCSSISIRYSKFLLLFSSKILTKRSVMQSSFFFFPRGSFLIIVSAYRLKRKKRVTPEEWRVKTTSSLMRMRSGYMRTSKPCTVIAGMRIPISFP
ncbi:Uncharacterised protein [uncultured archaeon]|nr:Uncharacterised protein [uncultured archaeon]